IRQIGNELRKYKNNLGKLISMEMGKILAEGKGEVQEMIDVADFAVGLSRQLYGLTMHSERPFHRMYEQWHPLGTVGIVSSFNFPASVWSWNSFIAAVCGDTMIWKPSSKTPLTAIAIQHLVNKIFNENNLDGIMNLVIGSGDTIGEIMIADKRIPLISATGSFTMGRRVGSIVGGRLGKVILELGGNNAIIVMDDSNLDLTVRAILFGAVGTSGQRCTTTRRVIVHNNIAKKLVDSLKKAYKQIRIGDPLIDGILMGPLVDKSAVNNMMTAIDRIKNEGGKIIYGGNVLQENEYKNGFYVEPCIVLANKDMKILQEETFAPILYVIEVSDYEEAIFVHNNVPQGLSSAIFTTNLISAEKFLSVMGSDCGIANVNIGTSGAEIGGAFGGEKDTGGGRESGSDSWKAYMRRQTNTINWSNDLPLAQGIKFGN
ncbi:MAG: aldehyde dehydrogenase family protein, partial [Spirochaetota bacterium]|nr:aldehyde dehydrogenase family protein [Spirochaetota bacterium]